MTSAPPLKTQRQQCWAQRDAYFACLDRSGLWLNGLSVAGHDAIVALDSSKPPVRSETDPGLTPDERNRLFVCKQDLESFQKECLASWVFHFSMLRVKEMQTAHLVEHQRKKDEALRNKGGSDAFWDKVKEKTQK
ncbi:hypothetical protein BC830DRAFT_1138618 [Chytriomyces sp. MP71]|nr:hypothetical protein BC830DRAFT_1138618 [Chytriomyces sp. MP71]